MTQSLLRECRKVIASMYHGGNPHADLLKRLDAQLERGGWQRVSERLPDTSGDVLIYHNLGDVERPEVPHAYDVAAYINGKWVFPWDRDQRNNPPRWVQFWQPLPAAPQPERNVVPTGPS